MRVEFTMKINSLEKANRESVIIYTSSSSKFVGEHFDS